MDAHTWPPLLYKGEVAGEDFNLNNRQDGLFEGYLVIKHILTVPSSALAGDNFHISNTCNALIHDMMSVKAEHIAYAAVQARSSISSPDKWSENHGPFSYHKFFYRIVDAIRNPPDKAWATAILQHYNFRLHAAARLISYL
ncbi:hypothetical protein BDR03DRAFT_1010044 [Suillus americanus]|nr:hypothetical protein BDR03DRAFT_1010044 [Suillus americanus]